MQGYWGNEEATKAAITADGWLHTGDVGALDADGYLRITDRKKDFIKTNGGDMVSPARVEGLLMQQPGIAQAVVAGDGRPHLVALIVPAEGADEVAVTLAVEAANKRLSVAERVRKWRLVEPFTIENGMMTPTQKIRRPAVLGQYREAVSGLYR
jgi:long-chain acyl-CoA synthetase